MNSSTFPSQSTRMTGTSLLRRKSVNVFQRGTMISFIIRGEKQRAGLVADVFPEVEEIRADPRRKDLLADLEVPPEHVVRNVLHELPIIVERDAVVLQPHEIARETHEAQRRHAQGKSRSFQGRP